MMNPLNTIKAKIGKRLCVISTTNEGRRKKEKPKKVLFIPQE